MTQVNLQCMSSLKLTFVFQPFINLAKNQSNSILFFLIMLLLLKADRNGEIIDHFGCGKRQVLGLSGWEIKLSNNSILNRFGAHTSLLLLSSPWFVTWFRLEKQCGAGKSCLLLMGFWMPPSCHSSLTSLVTLFKSASKTLLCPYYVKPPRSRHCGYSSEQSSPGPVLVVMVFTV